MNKRIVFLVRNVAPDKYGGGESYQLKLAQELRKSGLVPVIVTNSGALLRVAKKNDFGVLIPPYCKRQNWSGWRNLLLPWYFVFQFRLKRWYRKAIKEYRPAVINIQSRDDMIAGTIVANKEGVRVLWTDHADFKNWVLWNVNAKFKNIIGKRIVKLSRVVYKVILVSDVVAKETKRMIRPLVLENAEVIVNGVEDESDRYDNVSKKKKSFIFMGRIASEKGISELLNAFEVVNKKCPEASLLVYGDGGADEYKDDVCKKRQKNVQFCSWREDYLRTLAENEIFVLPSYREGLSLSLLDAAMMGKKIIASDVDGNPEVVVDKKTGLLVPAKNVEKLAEAMLYMLENKKEAGEMAKNARRYYEENFDFKKIFKEKMLPLYNSDKEEDK